MLDINQQAFFTLVRAGLWEQDSRLPNSEMINFREVFHISEKQSVIGLIAAGLEHVQNARIPREVSLRFVGDALQLEKRNAAMNEFIAEIIEWLRCQGIRAILVKGQGVAQCYERPLWRSSGDVDLLFNSKDYEKSVEILSAKAIKVEPEYKELKHLGLIMSNGFILELHGTLHSRLSTRIDQEIDVIQKEVFYNGKERLWMNQKTPVFLPCPDDDIILLFSHILQHFYTEGVGLRQICDWCRCLWKFKDELNVGLLESRIRRMRLLLEWKAFASFAVYWLGMPTEAMPLFSSKRMWQRKSNKICKLILELGNFGHNRDLSFMLMKSSAKRKVTRFWFITKDTMNRFLIFPINSLRVWIKMMRMGISSLINNGCKIE